MYTPCYYPTLSKWIIMCCACPEADSQGHWPTFFALEHDMYSSFNLLLI